MLVAPKAVDVGRVHVGDGRQTVQILAIYALGTNAACEIKAEVGAGRLVGFGVAAVFGNVATPLCLCLTGIFVIVVAAAPFVVPNIKYGPCWWWWLGLERRSVDLRSRRSSFASYDLLHPLAFSIGGDDSLFGGDGDELRG